MKRRSIIWLMIVSVLIAITYNYNQHEKVNRAKKAFIYEGVNPSQYINCIDFSKKVELYQIRKGQRFIQYQVEGNPQGNFYGLDGATPSELGISDIGYNPETKTISKKEKRTYVAVTDQIVLATYSAAVVDDWSTPEIETQTVGNEVQLFSTCKKCFERIE